MSSPVWTCDTVSEEEEMIAIIFLCFTSIPREEGKCQRVITKNKILLEQWSIKSSIFANHILAFLPSGVHKLQVIN